MKSSIWAISHDLSKAMRAWRDTSNSLATHENIEIRNEGLVYHALQRQHFKRKARVLEAWKFIIRDQRQKRLLIIWWSKRLMAAPVMDALTRWKRFCNDFLVERERQYVLEQALRRTLKRMLHARLLPSWTSWERFLEAKARHKKLIVSRMLSVTRQHQALVWRKWRDWVARSVRVNEFLTRLSARTSRLWQTLAWKVLVAGCTHSCNFEQLFRRRMHRKIQNGWEALLNSVKIGRHTENVKTKCRGVCVRCGRRFMCGRNYKHYHSYLSPKSVSATLN